MENAEEVMQLLEEFTKVRPKEIPKELEDYLCYVAKTGDPVYQWSLVKNLFREKLIKVITDFFETTLTVELPPCPNVEPFNYDRMKNGLLERFDTFNSAPFTVQRICELLTNPRKEYNRADKYMRAIEKNILVVSTREPGSGKRPVDIDSQQETILNGIPDVKVNEYDGSLMHVPADLPFLGAPPASNVVTVETSEPIFLDTVSNRIGFDVNINGDSKTATADSSKSWVTQEPSVSVEIEQAGSSSELLDVEETLSNEKSLDRRDCDADSRFVRVENCPSNLNTSNIEAKSESGSDVLILNNEIVVSEVTSVDSSDSNVVLNHQPPNSEESLNSNDENEVTSTPIDIVAETLVLEEVDVPLNSEAEATDISIDQNLKSEEKLSTDLPDNEINTSRLIQSNETVTVVTVTEVSGSNDSTETSVGCSENEITGTVESPLSPVSIISSQSTDAEKLDKSVQFSIEKSEQSDSHPDSSNDVSAVKEVSVGSLPTEDSLKLETCTTEADSVSETDEGPSKSKKRKSEVLEESETLDQGEITHCSSSPTSRVSSGFDNINVVEESCENPTEETVSLPSSSVLEQTSTSENEAVCLDTIKEDSKLTTSGSITEVSEIIYDQEQREESVIQTLPNIPSDNLKNIDTVEEISVDPGCEEEAMDVDDGSNQMMMVSEGENEGEPMDQSDQLLS